MPRSSALLNYLTVLEAESVKATLFSAGSPAAALGAHRQAVESSAHAIPAIFEQCPPDEAWAPPTVTREVFGQANELFIFTQKYDQIEYCYKLAERGHFEISVAKKDPRITFSYSSPEEDQADTPARAREMLPRFSEGRSSPNQGAISEINERLGVALVAQTRLVQPETCEYVLNGDVLSVVRDLAKTMSEAMPVRIDSNVEVGQFTFGDFHAIWSALLSLIQTHATAHDLACGGDVTQFPIGTSVLLKQRAEMSSLLSSISGLSYQTAEFILGCYIYNPKTSGKGPLCQPIFPMAGDQVCVSSLILSHFDFERNFFKLLHRSPSLLAFAASVDSQKEPIALRYLSALFPESDFATRRCVTIPGRTDADLLVYERRSGLTLVIQHKWLTAPETPEESSENDDRLKKGITQGLAARDYCRSNQAFVREALKLPRSAPILRVECVTVCRGLEGSSFMERSDVPVAAEEAFEALFKQDEGLEGLWAALLTRPDKTLAAERAVDCKITIELGGYEFVMPALGF